MILGSTGTRQGMTPEQKDTVAVLVQPYAVLHHGDCVGSDEEMHDIAGAAGLHRVIHPPLDRRYRAFCQGEETLKAKAYLTRDRDIVFACDVLIATPAEDHHMTHGGTWYTVDFAIPIRPVGIVWPDGSMSLSVAGLRIKDWPRTKPAYLS
jgi:hypothetical protein